MEALFQHASKLPRVEFARPPARGRAQHRALDAVGPGLRLRRAGGRHLRAHARRSSGFDGEGGGHRRPGAADRRGVAAPSTRSTSSSPSRGCASSTERNHDLMSDRCSHRPRTAARRGCPITADFLPPNMRKHVDPKAPVPLRMMAAKALVPLSPSDMMGALFMLTFDPDAEGARHGGEDRRARCRIGSSPRRCATRACSRRCWAGSSTLLASKDAYAEMLILNATTPDDAVARVARRVQRAQPAEIIGAEPAAPAAPRRHHPAALPQPERRRRADRRRLRLRGALRADPRRRAADEGGAGAHLRPRGGREAARPGPHRRRGARRSSRSSATRSGAADGGGQAAHPHPADHEDEHRGEDQARHQGQQGGARPAPPRLATSWWRWR